jgi:hypothetical protein
MDRTQPACSRVKSAERVTDEMKFADVFEIEFAVRFDELPTV